MAGPASRHRRGPLWDTAGRPPWRWLCICRHLPGALWKGTMYVLRNCDTLSHEAPRGVTVAGGGGLA